MRWHQDIQAWPHTSFGVLTFGVYLEDTGSEQGPLTALPGSHRGPIFEQFDDGGRWTGALSARDVATLPADRAVELCGPAGTVVLLHCRVVHGSAANHSPRMRPLLLNVYSAADTLPITPAPAPTTKTGVLVRGQEPSHVHMEPYPARLPPRWDQVGYRSIFAAQSTRGLRRLVGDGGHHLARDHLHRRPRLARVGGDDRYHQRVRAGARERPRVLQDLSRGRAQREAAARGRAQRHRDGHGDLRRVPPAGARLLAQRRDALRQRIGREAERLPAVAERAPRAGSPQG